MSLRFTSILLLAAAALAGRLLAADAQEWLSTQHTVAAFLAEDKLAIDFKGLKTGVKLAHLTPLKRGDKAKDYAQQNLVGKQVFIVPEDALGLSEDGLAQVYVFIKGPKGNEFVNEDLVRLGFCGFHKGQTAQYAKFLDRLAETAASAKAPAEYEGATSFCSELNSQRYHAMTCKWAQSMNAQSRITYENCAAAEKAGKSPCSLCLYERVKDLRASGAGEQGQEKLEKIKGNLIGLKTDDQFYSPVAKQVAAAKIGDIITYPSLKEAVDSGRKPDMGSLCIDNPAIPAPQPGECIGRAPPHFRPCRAKTDHPSGLCEACRNVRSR